MGLTRSIAIAAVILIAAASMHDSAIAQGKRKQSEAPPVPSVNADNPFGRKLSLPPPPGIDPRLDDAEICKNGVQVHFPEIEVILGDKPPSRKWQAEYDANVRKAASACTKVIASKKNKGSELAVFYYHRSLIYKAAGQQAPSAKDINEAIRLDSNNIQYLGERVSATYQGAYDNKEQRDRVIRYLDEIVSIKPKTAQEVELISDHYITRAGLFEIENQFERALTDYREADRLVPGAANKFVIKLLRDRAKKQIGAGDLDGAIAGLTEGLKINSSSSLLAALLKERAALWKQKREPELAIADLAKAIETKPNDAELLALYKERIVLLKERGDTNGVLADLGAAARLKIEGKERLALYRERIALHAEQGNLDAALADLAEAEKLKLAQADSAGLFESRLTLLAKAGPDRALVELSKLIDAKPAAATLVKLHTRRADLWMANGNLEGAAYDRDQAITAATAARMTGAELAALYPARAQLRKERNRLDDAIADLGAAIKAASSAPIALALFQERAALARRKGDRGLEIADLTEILNRTPKDQTTERVHLYVELAGLHTAKGAFDGAIAALTEAATLDPGNVNLLFLRVDALKAKGALPEAENLLSRFLAQPADQALHEKARAALAQLHSPAAAAPAQPPAPSQPVPFAAAQPAPAKQAAEVAPPPPQTQPAQIAIAPASLPPQLAAVPSAPQPTGTPSAQPPINFGRRVALVVGINSYPKLKKPDNPRNMQLVKAVADAETMGATLKTLGFDVEIARDVDREAFLTALDRLKRKIAPGDTVFVFYAGHGVAFQGTNLLLPSSIPPVDPEGEQLLRGLSVAEADIIEALREKGAGLTILVLDACRDNPIEEFRKEQARIQGRPFRSMAGMRSVGLEVRPTSGVYTIYSAGIGQTALDRLSDREAERNSVFTRVFAKKLLEPGRHLSDIMEDVKEEVAALAAKVVDPVTRRPHRQFPAYYNETLGGRIFLAGPTLEQRKAAPAP